MNLPKKYLSYSQISLWEKNKEGYRRRYYDNEPSAETLEMVYGKKIAKILETGRFNDHPILGKIPRYDTPEHKIDLMIDDVPFMGYIDSYDSQGHRFIEYKTGRNGPNNKPRWDLPAVYKTDQIPIYSLMIKEKYGEVDNLAHLVWLRTVFTKKTMEFEGHVLESDDKDVKIDGHFEVFERNVFEYERQAMREKIIRIANEIEQDYDYYKRTKEGVLSPIAEALVQKP